MTLLYKLIIFTVFCALVSAEIDYGITWAMSGRVHSELTWKTIETEKFNVHYHTEIEEIAKAGANISKQVLPLLLEQLNIADIPKINIILTSEDEVMNGFAMFTNTTFIWVDQNDAAVWLENGKWLEQVLAHELQHIVYFNKVKTWLPEPYSLMLSKTPNWFVEGIAEYYTEKWRPYRSEISHKYHTLKNTTSSMDPHHDGYSKIKLMAQTYGDSSITKLLEHRTKLKTFNFGKAFKHATGISVSDFNELWRRIINTYYYGFRAQKETYEDVGEVSTLPISKLSSSTSSFRFSNDSLHIAMIGKENSNNLYSSLIIASMDTTKIVDDKKNIDDEKGNKKTTPNYLKKEIDSGRLHPFINWSNNGEYLCYSKYHYSNNSSMVWDLRVYNTKTKKELWLTQNMRATYPTFSSKNEIVFVSHTNSTSNLFKIDFENNLIPVQLTNFSDNIQILSPIISKDGALIAFSMSKEDGNLDIYTLEIPTNTIKRITFNDSVDYLPIFDLEGNIIFTSHRGGVPNIFKIDQDHNVHQCTDVSDGIWGVQNLPKDSMIIANTLNDVDSARVVTIAKDRTVIPTKVNFNDQYSLWKNHNPKIQINFKDINKIENDYSESIKKYSSLRHLKHQTTAIIPFGGLIINTTWADALSRNIFILGGGTYRYDFEDLYENFPSSFLIFSYTNALHGPLFGMNYYYNTNLSIRNYDKGGLLERKDGASIWMQFPYNTGNSLSSNHSLKFEASALNRYAIAFHDTIDTGEIDSYELPEPENGNDNVLSVNYKYLNRKPQKSNRFLPSQGFGLEFRIEKGSRGKFLNYEKYSLDSFFNYTIKGFIIYSRLKFKGMHGNLFPQDKIWFSQDKPIYISGNRGAEIFHENLNPRGWIGNPIKGDNMFFNTIEIRKALPIELPIEVMGIKPGKISIALFQDYGIVSKEAVHTLGYEIKVSILSLKSPILFISYGEAQSLTDWVNEEAPHKYVQMSLINPF